MAIFFCIQTSKNNGFWAIYVKIYCNNITANVRVSIYHRCFIENDRQKCQTHLHTKKFGLLRKAAISKQLIKCPNRKLLKRFWQNGIAAY